MKIEKYFKIIDDVIKNIDDVINRHIFADVINISNKYI